MTALLVFMKDQLFADSEYSKMLKKLGFDEKCIAKYYEGRLEIGGEWTNSLLSKLAYRDSFIVAPLWTQIKQWLWEERRVWLDSSSSSCSEFKVTGFYCKDYGMPQIFQTKNFTSPIDAEIEGVKKAVEHLLKQLEK